MKKGNKLKMTEDELGVWSIEFLPREISDEEIIKRMESLGFQKSRNEFRISKQIVYTVKDDERIIEESNDPLFIEILEKGRKGRINVSVLDKN